MNLHECSKCKVAYPWNKYQLYKGRPIGQCRTCKNASMKEHRAKLGMSVRKKSIIADGKKLCMHCNEFVSLNMFSKTTRGLGGVSAYCQPCVVQRYKPTAEKTVAATQTYRKKNRERYLASHRVNMYERRHKIKVTADGTVTDAYLKSLYAWPICHYCEKFTEVDQRTADHKTPLNLGGQHSAKNLVMACFTCNSSKRDLPYAKFKRKLKNENIS
jgi:5-methylcytosine-specific restriction endonuclease McrA